MYPGRNVHRCIIQMYTAVQKWWYKEKYSTELWNVYRDIVNDANFEHKWFSITHTRYIHLSTAHTYIAYNSYNALQNVSTTDSFRLDAEAARGSNKTHQIQMQLTETPSQVNHWLFDIIFDALNSIIINIVAVINIFFIFFCLHSMEGVINGPSVDKISTLVWPGQLIQQLNYWPGSICSLVIIILQPVNKF